MSNSRQILAMLNSKAQGDDEHFYSIALQVAAAEARQGRRSIAEDLRSAVEKARAKASKGPSVTVPISSPRGDLAGLIEMRTPRFKLSDVVLNNALRDRINDFVIQQQRRDWLREYGKTPNRRLLFVGAPGSGKTMSAEALAGELRLPLFVIRLESLITRFMGETAAKLRLVFDETNRHRGVYLFDEFDAVGGNRSASNDVAEMRRVLNSFLQFMEEPNATDSVIVGATNYPDLLDPALLRRFDLVLEFAKPSNDEIKTIIKSNVRPMKYPNLSWKKIVAAAQGLSQSEISRATEDAVKGAILSEKRNVTTDELVGRLNDRQSMKEAFASSIIGG